MRTLSEDIHIINLLFKGYPALIKGTQNLPNLRAPSLPNLPPCHPLGTPLSEVLTLGNLTLVNRAGEQGDAMPADFIAEVLAGDADGTRTGRAQNINIHVVPLLSRDRSRRGSHHSKARTSVLILTL